MTNHSFGPLSSLSPSSLRPSAASTPPPSPPMDLATPPPTPPIDLATPPPTPPIDLATPPSSPLIESPHQASASPAAMPPPPPSSPQGWNSPSHPQLAAVGWQSPEQSPSSTAISGASLWALGDPVCRALFRESEDNEPSPADNDEAATLLPTAVFELIKLTVKYLVNSLLQKHRQDVCQGCEVSHPSQRRHSCLFPLEKYYFFKYYDELSRRLWNGHFTNTLLQILRLEGFSPPAAQVRGVAQAYLFELREASDIETALLEIESSVTEVTRTTIDKVLYDKYSLWLP